MKLQDQLQGILNDLQLASTETSLMVGAIVLLIVGLIAKNSTLLKLVYLGAIFSALFLNLQITDQGVFLSESLFADGEIISFVSLFLIFGTLILIFPRTKHSSEFYFLILSLLVGSIFMVKGNSLLLIYLAIELVSFVSYILTGFSFKKIGFEASIKYLLFGAISSAIMLIGLGLIYGSTASFYLSEWNAELFSSPVSQIGLLFLLFGVLFKASIFPFHIWTPATYQSAPVDSVAFFSVVPKLAGLLLLKRILADSGIGYFHWLIGSVLILGILTIVIGTLGALRQSNVRRMISFGSIAHSGFLLGFIVVPVHMYNADAFWWYAVVYGVMNYGAFYLIDRYETSSIYLNEQYAQTSEEVLIGGAFTLILVSLVGLPPLAGFSAKLFLFSSLWETYVQSNSMLPLTYLFVAVLATVASLFFYMKVPKNIFLSEASTKESELSIVLSLKAKIIATIFTITLLMLFFVPELVMRLQTLLNSIHE